MIKHSKRYFLLDIARGLAAFAVVIFHYRLFYDQNISSTPLIKKNFPYYDLIQVFYEFGFMAVQFFFVLSGYIFYDIYLKQIKQKTISFKDFFLLRFSRLYPLHFITLLIMVFVFFLFKSIDMHFFNLGADIKHFLLNILLIQEWGLKDFESFNSPSWSVSIEILMYGIFFFVFSKNYNNWYTTIILIIFSIPIFFVYKNIGYGGYCFFIGGLTFLFFDFIEKKYENKKLITIFSLFFLLSLCLIYFINYNYINKIIIYTFSFPSLILTLMFLQKIYSNLGKTWSIIGDISYSVYMIHFVVQSIISFYLAKNQIKINFDSNYVFLSYILLIFLLSLITFKTYEKPLQTLIRNKFNL